MALPLRSVSELTSHALQHASRSSIRDIHNSMHAEALRKQDSVPVSLVFRLRPQRHVKNTRWSRLPSATDSDKVTSETSDMGSDVGAEVAIDGSQPPSSNIQPLMNDGDKSNSTQSTPKRPPLTAREKLRAARVLSKYTEAKPSKSAVGSNVLDALRESDRGKKKSGLPEAPSNLLDDSKRGMPKAGLTFDFPGGNDLLLIAFSFVFISTVMFTTTYIVWKVGAIHFNEY